MLDSGVWLDATEGRASCRLLGQGGTGVVEFGPSFTEPSEFRPKPALLTPIVAAPLPQITVLKVRLKSNLIRQHFKPIVASADLAPLRLYDLRHTCATLMLGLGIHAKIVAERLGHASTAMTLDVYSHVAPTLQEEAAHKLGAALFGP